jgi:hypothetical protein
MAPAALRTTGADITAFSGVGCYMGDFPSPRRLAFQHTPSGFSSPTRKLVTLAATCGSRTRPAPTTPGAPSAFPASPTPLPFKGVGRHPPAASLIYKHRALLRAAPCSPGSILTSKLLQWMAFLYGPPGLDSTAHGARSRDSPRLRFCTLPRLLRPRSASLLRVPAAYPRHSTAIVPRLFAHPAWSPHFAEPLSTPRGAAASPQRPGALYPAQADTSITTPHRP